MKSSVGLALVAAIAAGTTSNAIRILSAEEAADAFSPAPAGLVEEIISTHKVHDKPCSIMRTKSKDLWSWITTFSAAGGHEPTSDTGPTWHHHHWDRYGSKDAHPHLGYNHHHHKSASNIAIYEEHNNAPLSSGTVVVSPSWLTAIYALGSPHPSKFVGSDNADENAIVEAMLRAEKSPMTVDEQDRFWRHSLHEKQGHREGHVRALCLKGRIMNALASLKPFEAGIMAFALGAGIGSLLRITFMLILLARRSHAYLNEAAEATSGQAEGYPGAAYQAIRAAHEEDLPPYGEHSISISEKIVSQNA